MYYRSNSSPNREIKPKRTKSEKSKAMDLADKYFSQYIRLSHCIVDRGECFCKDIITGKYRAIKDMDNGHYVSRDYKAVRYNPDNCRPQNRSSNRFRGEADKDKFKDHLLREIGQERLDEIEKSKRDYFADSTMTYNLIADKYRNLVNQLIKEMNIENPFRKND